MFRYMTPRWRRGGWWRQCRAARFRPFGCAQGKERALRRRGHRRPALLGGGFWVRRGGGVGRGSGWSGGGRRGARLKWKGGKGAKGKRKKKKEKKERKKRKKNEKEKAERKKTERKRTALRPRHYRRWCE